MVEVFEKQLESEPESPYVTMELSPEYKVVQVRGHHNTYPTSDVMNFVSDFKKAKLGFAAT